MNKLNDLDIFNLDYYDIKNTSIFIEEYYLKYNDLDDNEYNFLLIKSLQTGNFFIFNLLNVENKNIYFSKMLDTLQKKKENIFNKIKITTNNDEKTLSNYLKKIKKFENINENDFKKLELFFYTLLYFEELIEKLQTSVTIYL